MDRKVLRHTKYRRRIGKEEVLDAEWFAAVLRKLGKGWEERWRQLEWEVK